MVSPDGMGGIALTFVMKRCKSWTGIWMPLEEHGTASELQILVSQSANSQSGIQRVFSEGGLARYDFRFAFWGDTCSTGGAMASRPCF